MDTATRIGILAGGVWLIDSTKYIDHYPAPSRLATVSEVVRSNGGGAFNLLVDLARLGAEFPLSGVGLIGDDASGAWIEDVCRRYHIAMGSLRRVTHLPTAATDVMTEAGSGRRTFFYLPGANVELSADHFPLAETSARILYLGYPGLVPALDRRNSTGQSGLESVLHGARGAGLITAVDLVSADHCDWRSVGQLLPQIDLLFLNEWEAARLLDKEPLADETVSSGELHQMAAAVLAQGVRRAVVIHCAHGAVCVSADSSAVIQGAVKIAPEEIRGSCGAGDALAAGFLLAFHRGERWADCLELAVCAAATCLQHLTSSDGVRATGECLAYGRARGYAKF